MNCELCNANPCQCVEKPTPSEPDPPDKWELAEKAEIWWISLFKRQIEQLQSEVSEIKGML